jgi:hypothetical protein
MQTLLATLSIAAESAKPAGGAAIGEVVGATAGALVATTILFTLIYRHRTGKTQLLEKLAGASERVTGMPGWASLPSVVGTGSLLIALLGMYWDIALHINVGRDEGPLANPAHYLILVGLFGIFAAGCIAVGLPKGEKPTPSAVRITEGWYAPVGAILIALAGGYALLGFPLDDMWHRLFGQDVTLWGPTHLMLIGGAGMTLIGQAILLREGRPVKDGEAAGERSSRYEQYATYIRRVSAMGGLLIGLSTFQAEFDFGVPQFHMVFQPVLIAIAAGIALVASRIWIGPGAAFGAVAFFLVVRGGVSLIVGPVFGETTPALPLYVGGAACVELAALLISRERPIALGAAAGALIGTVGFWAEWGWSQVVMQLPWNENFLPEALIASAVAGVAGGVIGGLLGSGLRGKLPQLRTSQIAFGVGMVAIIGVMALFLVPSKPEGYQAAVTLTDAESAPNREVTAQVRITPASVADDANWVQMTSWQGGGRVVDELERTGPGTYESTKPVPVYGNWKTMLRLHEGNALLGIPVYLPEDPAIPAPAVKAEPQFTRTFVDETKILQRELKDDVPGWIWAAASLTVLAISLSFILALAWGLGRAAGGAGGGETRPPRGRAIPVATPGQPART